MVLFLLISMKKFDFEFMLRMVERFGVTHLAVAPPTLVAPVNYADEASEFDLSSLEVMLLVELCWLRL